MSTLTVEHESIRLHSSINLYAPFHLHHQQELLVKPRLLKITLFSEIPLNVILKSDFVQQWTTQRPERCDFNVWWCSYRLSPSPPPPWDVYVLRRIYSLTAHTTATDRQNIATIFPSNVANKISHGTTLYASRTPNVLRVDIHPWRSPFSRPSCCVFRWWANKRNFYATRKAATCNNFTPKHLYDELRATGVGLTNKIRLQLTG